MNYLILDVTLQVSYKGVMKKTNRTFTLDEICALVEMNKRKIRYYIQKGLLDRPEGTGKGAYYTHQHIEQLLEIRKWKDAGLSLERIQELLSVDKHTAEGGLPTPPPRPPKAGSVEVWSHLHIADGITLQIEPQRAGLSPEKVRSLCKSVVEAFERLQSGGQ